MHCARCSKAGMIEIRMRVAERDVTFRRCGRCEAQTWETADGPVPLVHVLELARIALSSPRVSCAAPPGMLTGWCRRRS